MYKRFFSLLFILCLLQPVFAQQKTSLIKANTGDPAVYIRSVLATANKGGYKKMPVLKEEDDDRRKVTAIDKVYTRGAGKKMFEQNMPDIAAANDNGPAVSAIAMINNNLTNCTDCEGQDPMIAAGEKTIAVSNSSWLRFYDKVNGGLLLSISSTNLFERYLSATINGQPNPEFASNFYNTTNNVPYWCSKSSACKVDTVPKDPDTGENLPCVIDATAGLIQRAYDSRVFYQKESRRFIIIAALRNETSADNNYYNPDGDKDCSPYLVRLVGIAVSVSENPMDGFYIYRTGENNYRDWPNAVADQDYLVLAHKAGDKYSNGHSIVTVYNYRQMMAGVGPVINGFKILQNDDNGTPQTVIPISNTRTGNQSTAFFFLQNKNLGAGKIKIWYIKKPANPATIFQNPPSSLKEAGLLSYSDVDFTDGGYGGIVYSGKAIHFATHQRWESSSGTRQSGFAIHYFKIPVIGLNNGSYELSGAGLEHEVFDHAEFSYLNPSVAVDALQNVVMQFIRVPRSKNTTALPQVRYKVKFYQQAEWKSSILLKQWSQREDITYLEDKGKLMDYSWVAKDPFKLSVFWIANRVWTPGGDRTNIMQTDLGTF
ncbi:MAG: hypothetical protein NTW29_22685 [Bacteroidetes bacterium]|nr:hypothetical protein [Bacteroidota bacterium]